MILDRKASKSGQNPLKNVATVVYLRRYFLALVKMAKKAQKTQSDVQE